MENTIKEGITLDVGQRLRTLREERNVSMRALARRSGLSANALSMIERGLTSPSVTTLHKLASALEVPITAFFRQEPPRSRIVLRKAEGRAGIPIHKGWLEGLGGESFTGRVEPFLVTLQPGACSGGNDGMIHTGHEFAFVIQGQVEYRVADETHRLQPGDSLLFVAQIPHRWENVGEDEARLLLVLSGFEDSERPSEFHMVLPGEDGSDCEEA